MTPPLCVLAGDGDARQAALVQGAELLASLITAGTAVATSDVGRTINGLACSCDEISWVRARGLVEVAVDSMQGGGGVVKEVKGWADGCRENEEVAHCRLVGMVRRLGW